MADYHELVEGLRKIFKTGKTKNVEWRIQQLQGLKRMFEENQKLMIEVGTDLYCDRVNPKNTFNFYRHSRRT